MFRSLQYVHRQPARPPIFGFASGRFALHGGGVVPACLPVCLHL
jgi:hypothetical protein